MRISRLVTLGAVVMFVYVMVFAVMLPLDGTVNGTLSSPQAIVNVSAIMAGFVLVLIFIAYYIWRTQPKDPETTTDQAAA